MNHALLPTYFNVIIILLSCVVIFYQEMKESVKIKVCSFYYGLLIYRVLFSSLNYKDR